MFYPAASFVMHEQLQKWCIENAKSTGCTMLNGLPDVIASLSSMMDETEGQLVLWELDETRLRSKPAGLFRRFLDCLIPPRGPYRVHFTTAWHGSFGWLMFLDEVGNESWANHGVIHEQPSPKILDRLAMDGDPVHPANVIGKDALLTALNEYQSELKHAN